MGTDTFLLAARRNNRIYLMKNWHPFANGLVVEQVHFQLIKKIESKIRVWLERRWPLNSSRVDLQVEIREFAGWHSLEVSGTSWAHRSRLRINHKILIKTSGKTSGLECDHVSIRRCRPLLLNTRGCKCFEPNDLQAPQIESVQDLPIIKKNSKSRTIR